MSASALGAMDMLAAAASRATAADRLSRVKVVGEFRVEP